MISTFFTLLEFFSSLKLIEIVRKVSPTWAVKAIATEKNFEPTWAGGDVLPRVVVAPAFDKAYSNAVRIDGTELDAAYRWWPCDGFVDSTRWEEKYLVDVRLNDCRLELTLGDQMHEDNGLVAPCVRLWFWNPYRRVSANVQILVMMIGCKAKHHPIHDLMSLLRRKINKSATVVRFYVSRFTYQVQSFPSSSILCQVFVLSVVELAFVCKDQRHAPVHWRHRMQIPRRAHESQHVRWAPSMPTRTSLMSKDLKATRVEISFMEKQIKVSQINKMSWNNQIAEKKADIESLPVEIMTKKNVKWKSYKKPLNCHLASDISWGNRWNMKQRRPRFTIISALSVS